MTSITAAIVFFTLVHAGLFASPGDFLGCYKDVPGANLTRIEYVRDFKDCIDNCAKKLSRYAMMRESSTCNCGNYIGDLHDKNFCNVTCDNCDLKPRLSNVYFANTFDIGPPRNFIIGNITDSTVHLEWQTPDTLRPVDSYKVNAYILHTYSTMNLMYPSWTFSNNTYQAEIGPLHPATKYNITIQAVSSQGIGAITWQIFETKIAEPDQTPESPLEKYRDKTKATLQLKEVANENGPITSYIIVVLNKNSVQTFDKNNLKTFRDAFQTGLPYYITAEFPARNFTNMFIVGDGRMYGRFYNAPLDQNIHYNYILGIKSDSPKDNLTYVVYSNHASQDVFVEVMNTEENDSPGLIIFLSIAIGLLALLLVVSVIGFIILRNRILHRNRQRLTDNQELTFQGPIISVENSGYVPEDEGLAPNHYENLNEQVWIIPRNLLNIQHTCLLGKGKFGMVHSGTVHKDNTLKTVAVYSIADGKLDPSDKRAMLKDLDTLIRAEKHENLLDLIGTCESIDTVCVVLEYVSTNLKELLLGCRNNSPGKFCNVQSSQLLEIAINIAKGMAHLESKNISHKQLCARNISIINGFTPKISGFGLAQYYENNCSPIYTRWTAYEIFKGYTPGLKSDAWSFAVLLWEICALGGTPYGNIPNNEIPDRVIRNIHLKQLQYVGRNLYQLMLNCWQIDLDERPTFAEIVRDLYEIKEDKFSNPLSLDSYPGFQYEQYYAELELSTVA